jgi:cysteine-rich repeat protein
MSSRLLRVLLGSRTPRAFLVGVVALGVAGACGGDVPTNYLGGTSTGGTHTSAGDAGSGGADSGIPSGGSSASPSSGGAAANGARGGVPSTNTGGEATAGVGGAGSECGNGKTESSEECDDGNTVDADGCSSVCTKSCEECEAWHASHGNDACGLGPYCAALEGYASGGVAQGVARSELCLDVLGCIRRTGCVVPEAGGVAGVSQCYCGDSAACADPSGACAFEFESAAETSEPTLVGGRFSNYDYALAPATELVNACDIPDCYEECFEGRAFVPPEGGAGGQ